MEIKKDVSAINAINTDYLEKYGFSVPEEFVFQSKKGLSKEVVEEISKIKNEPQWMLDNRLKALKIFESRPMPSWGADLSKINFDEIIYYYKPSDIKTNTWDDVPEYIKKTFDKLGIPESEKKFLGGLGAQFECLTGDSLVFTNPKGPVRIDSIKQGDKVFTFDENTKKIKKSIVKKFGTKGFKEVYKIKVKTRSIKASENHPFLTLNLHKKPGKIRGRYKMEWRYLKDLKKGDLVAIVKDLPDFGKPYLLQHPNTNNRRYKIIKLPKETSKDLMWLFGIYLGDGFLHKEKNKARVEIAIPSKEQDVRRELFKIVKKLFKTDLILRYDDRVIIHSLLLANFIEMNGFGGKSHTKRLPNWVYSLPKEQKLALLAGYIDSDGYVRNHPKNKDPVITSCNKELLNDIKNLLPYCGLNSSTVIKFIQKNPFKKEENVTAYRLQISADTSKIPCRNEKRSSRLYNKKHFHDYSGAKNTTFKNHITNEIGFGRIDSINKVGFEPVYDIEVEGSHNFVANGFIVHNSESIYHNLREDLAAQGVIFTDMDTALKEHPDIVKKYFGTVIPAGDNKFAALNTAVWSGGSFVYIPKGVKVNIPLQAYFRINAKNIGQFERTLIIVDEGAEATYVEGCTSPVYSSNSLHSAVVEVIALKDAKVRYTTIQNWSNNVYNLVTKRAYAYENATVEWIDGNMGSLVTMKYPSVYLKGKNSKADIISVAFASNDQHQDAGGKVIHLAPNTTSRIISKSISNGNGHSSYRGLVRIAKGAHNSTSSVKCDALMLNEQSRSDTYPTMNIDEEDVTISHEAYVGKIGEDQLFYLMSRGLSESEAMSMIVLGFMAEFTKELPMEYAIELNKLIKMEMEGSVG